MKKKLWIAAWAALGFAAGASAAVITWDNAADMSADTDVSLQGTSMYAYSLNGSGGNITLNGLVFTEAAEGAPGVFGNLTSSVDALQNNVSFAGTAAPWINLSTEYKALVTGAILAGDDDTTYTLNGLTSGQEYLVQVWVNDPRDNANIFDRTATFYGDSTTTQPSKVIDYNVGNVAGAVGQYITGTFTADATSISWFAEGGGAKPGMQMNAMQLRAIPEPATIGLVAAFGGGILFIRRFMQI